MIDWIKIRFLCNHQFEISGDKLITIDQDGEVKWEMKKSRGIVGSHDSRIFIKSIPHALQGRGVVFNTPESQASFTHELIPSKSRVILLSSFKATISTVPKI